MSAEGAERKKASGTVFVVSAPSGAGKRTVLRRVLQQWADIAGLTSATTRNARPGEVDGQDYFFLTREEFQRRIQSGEFLEWAEVHGNLYGTLRAELERTLAKKKDVILELDVQGMRHIRAAKLDMVSIFIMPPSMTELERRLRERGANRDDDIALRLENARGEIAARKEFDYIIVNDNVDTAVADLEAILRARRLESARQP